MTTEQQATPTSEEKLRDKVISIVLEAKKLSYREGVTGADTIMQPSETVNKLMQLMRQYGNTRELEGRKLRDIRKGREDYNVTQADMAVVIGVSRLTLIGYEKDIDTMPIGRYKAYCRELDRLDELTKAKDINHEKI